MAAGTAACGSSSSGTPGPGVDGGGGAGGAGDIPIVRGQQPKAPNDCQAQDQLRLTNDKVDSKAPSITWVDGKYLVLWSDASTGSRRSIYGTFINGMGERTGGAGNFLVYDSPHAAISPRAVAAGGGGAAVVWEDCQNPSGNDCGGGSSVSGASLGNDGKAGAAKEISRAANVQRRPYLAAAFGKIYTTFRDLDNGTTVSRVVQLGDDLGPKGDPVTLPGESYYPHISANENRLAVVSVRGPIYAQVVLSLFDEALKPMGESIVRQGVPGESYNAVGAWLGSKWAVAWEDKRASSDEQLFGSLVPEEGGMAEPNTALPKGTGNWPTIASNGSSAIVAFYSFTDGAQIVIARIDSSGVRTEGLLELTHKPQRARFPSATYNPSNGEYGIVWQDDVAKDIFFGRVKCQ